MLHCENRLLNRNRIHTTPQDTCQRSAHTHIAAHTPHNHAPLLCCRGASSLAAAVTVLHIADRYLLAWALRRCGGGSRPATTRRACFQGGDQVLVIAGDEKADTSAMTRRRKQ